MEYTRTTTTNDSTIISALRGIQPKTDECCGPYLSQDRGMDAMCCARCNVLRQQIYRGRGTFIWNPVASDYLKALAERHPTLSLLSCCIVSTCNEQLIYLPVSQSELTMENVFFFIKQQMLLWKEMGIVGDILNAGVGHTKNGLPVITPGNDATKADCTSDEGVVIRENFFRIVDEKKALASKWSHVINCRKVLHLLFPNNKAEEFPKGVLSGETWYAIW